MAVCGPAEQAKALAEATRGVKGACGREFQVLQDLLQPDADAQPAVLGAKLSSILQHSFAEGELVLRKEALLLWASSMEYLPTDVKKELKPLLPGVLMVLQQCEHTQAYLRDCLAALGRVAEVSALAFQPNLEQFTFMMLSVARAKDRVPDDIRQTAFEILVSLAEKRSKMCLKVTGYVVQVVQLCMEYMLEIDDEADWDYCASKWNKANAANYEVGEENIDRIVKAFGASVTLPAVLTIVVQFMGHGCWRQRYVAIMALSQCAESVESEAEVDEIVQKLTTLTQDPHARVRYAALHAIGQTSTDQAPYVQEAHHQLVLPTLSRAMDDAVPRVAAHACAAFINFVEELPQEALLPHVPQLMPKLAKKMLSPARILAEQAVTAVAIIAGVAQTHFVPYYEELMPVLKRIVLTASQPEDKAFRGKAFECMSLLGMAVGKDVFRQDAREAMQAMMEIASQGIAPDDPQRSYIQEASQRICRALKEDFLPYLPYLLPGIFATLQTQPFEVLDPEAAEEQDDITLDYCEDGKVMGLQTTQIEDIKGAVHLLSCFLEVLGARFLEHLTTSATCLLPLLSFRFSDDVKRDAIQAWQELLSIARAGQTQAQDVEGLLRAFLQATLAAMQAEEDVDLLQVQAHGTIACIRAAGPRVLKAADLQDLTAHVRRLIEESTQRQRAAMVGVSEEDEDEQAEAEYYRDADLTFRSSLAELAGTLMEVYKEEMVQSQSVQHLLPLIQEYLQPQCDSNDKWLALYLVDDMLEKLGAATVPVWQTLVHPALAYIKDEDAWVRQAACLAVLHAAKMDAFAELAAPSASAVQDVVVHPASKQAGNVEATEAAVAALGILCRHHGGRLPNLELSLKTWVQALPMQVDYDHAVHTHELLMTFVRDGVEAIRASLGLACHVFLTIYETETSSKVLNGHIRAFFVELSTDRLCGVQPPLTDQQQQQAQRIIYDAQTKH